MTKYSPIVVLIFTAVTIVEEWMGWHFGVTKEWIVTLLQVLLAGYAIFTGVAHERRSTL